MVKRSQRNQIAQMMLAYKKVKPNQEEIRRDKPPHEQERFQGLLRELSTPVKGEQAKFNDNDVVGTSVFQSLVKKQFCANIDMQRDVKKE